MRLLHWDSNRGCRFCWRTVRILRPEVAIMEQQFDIAGYNGYTDVVRLLFEKGTNIEATRKITGATPLDSAAHDGYTDVVRLFLQMANIVATRSDTGSTPLDIAVFCGHIDMVRLLLEKEQILQPLKAMMDQYHLIPQYSIY
ncbi:ankyrin repeat-containing domain protein [Tirmania nivea]|nr:ankyrin repeat-containing domain protein [Tirmania nivea]